MPRLLTGNRLETGDVLWWAGDDWSLHLKDAVAVDAEGEALIARMAPQARINDLALIEADATQPRYLQTVWGFGYVFVPDGTQRE